VTGLAPVTMVSGYFDPLHPGHIAYLEEARALGLPLLCCVSSDALLRRKHAPLLSQRDRGRLMGALAVVDGVHLAAGATAAAIRAVRPRIFAKGSDWRGRLPDEELAACEELGVEIVFTETAMRSSTEILRRFVAAQEDTGIARIQQRA
jgi:cytidyltransferase-like protein